MAKLKATMISLALCVPGALSGCDDGDGGATSTTSAPATPGAPLGPSTSEQPPAYLVSARVFKPEVEQTFSYLQVLGAIDAGSKLETDKAIQLPGSTKLFTLPDQGWFAIASPESATLTRYALGADNSLVPVDPSISLEDWGVNGFVSDKLYVASPHKLYYPDPAGGQLVIIDPQVMAVRGTIALSDTLREGYVAHYADEFVLRDGRLLFSVGWFDWENDRVLPETGLVVIDTATDSVARFDVDPRCGGVRQPVTVEAGDTYFVSSAMAASAFKLGRYPLAPCALRIRAGDDHFDPLYNQDLAALGGGEIVGEPAPAGGNAIVMRVLDETLVDVPPELTSYGLASERAWRWLRWDVGANQVAPVASLAPSTADTNWFEVDGRIFASQAAGDNETTTLMELTASEPRPALSSPGFLSGLTRIR